MWVEIVLSLYNLLLGQHEIIKWGMVCFGYPQSWLLASIFNICVSRGDKNVSVVLLRLTTITSLETFSLNCIKQWLAKQKQWSSRAWPLTISSPTYKHFFHFQYFRNKYGVLCCIGLYFLWSLMLEIFSVLGYFQCPFYSCVWFITQD